MKFCPHCRKPSINETGGCPHCGKDLSGAASPEAPPSASSAAPDRGPNPFGTPPPPPASYSDEPGYDGFDDAPIELETVAPARAPARARPSRPSDVGFEAFDESAFIIEDHPSQPAPAHEPLPGPEPDQPSYGGLGGEDTGVDDGFELEAIGDMASLLSEDLDGPEPANRTPTKELSGGKADEVEAEFDPDELAEVAQFGPPPSSLLDTVRYALKVRKRAAELRAEAGKLEPALEPARRELENDLKRLGERAQVAGYSSAKTSALLEEVAVADARASNAQVTLTTERQRHEARLEELDKELDQVRAEMNQPRQREARLAGQLAAKQEERRQIDLRVQRIDIEVRNAEALIARHEAPLDAAQGEVDADLARKANEQRARLPGLHAAREELMAQRQHLEAPIDELSRELERVRAVLMELKDQRTGIGKARDEEESLHMRNKDLAANQTAEASQAARAKLAEVGRLIRIEPASPAWAQELFPEIDRKAARYHELRLSNARLLKAAESFDPKTVRKGYVILAAAGGLIVAAGIALISVISVLT